jgi:hypothetical protein
VNTSVSSRLFQYVGEFMDVFTSDGEVRFDSHVRWHNSVPNLHNTHVKISTLLPLLLP